MHVCQGVVTFWMGIGDACQAEMIPQRSSVTGITKRRRSGPQRGASQGACARGASCVTSACSASGAGRKRSACKTVVYAGGGAESWAGSQAERPRSITVAHVGRECLSRRVWGPTGRVRSMQALLREPPQWTCLKARQAQNLPAPWKADLVQGFPARSGYAMPFPGCFSKCGSRGWLRPENGLAHNCRAGMDVPGQDHDSPGGLPAGAGQDQRAGHPTARRAGWFS